MDSNKGPGGIQLLLAAEKEAQNIVFFLFLFLLKKRILI
jgi:hypothetical protein